MDRAAELLRLDLLQARQSELALHVPLPHERSVHEVAKAAVDAAIRELGRRLSEGAYWRRSGRRESEREFEVAV